MEISDNGKYGYVGNETVRTEEMINEQGQSSLVNPWTAARVHYAQVQIVLSWSSRVFQRKATLTKLPPRHEDQPPKERS